MPGYSLQGPGCVKELPQLVHSFHSLRPLIVTDSGMMKTGYVDRICSLLQEAGIKAFIFHETVPNPTDKNTYDGSDFYKMHSCDSLISLGGGSAHDCAKGIGLLVKNGGNIADYEGTDKLRHRLPPFIAVNTTAGTGSEITKFSVITDTSTHRKMTLVDWRLTPLISINDPELMVGLPAKVTAQSGLDALTHAIEAYVSTTVNPMTDAAAIKAIAMIHDSLPEAVKNGENMVARSSMAYAQYMAGMAFNTAGLGLVHAMAHQIGGLYDLPHGLCNALLLPYVMEFNLKGASQRYAEIARALGCDLSSYPPKKAGIAAVSAVRCLAEQVDVKMGLKAYGMKLEDVPMLSMQAFNDPIGRTNPVSATVPQIEEIYKAAWAGI
jgi:alcohol dehydrogenase